MAHARLSPSAAARWLSCPASVRMGEPYPDRESKYAREGTLAHALAEAHARARYLGTGGDTLVAWEAAYAAAYAAGYDADEMEHHIRRYVDVLGELMGGDSLLFLEQRVDTGIPSCWGTADAIIVTPSLGEVCIVDLKYGRGVAVAAEGNPQLRLYGLGALEYARLICPVDTVVMVICQPRTGGVSEARMSVGELEAWRDSIMPVAADALAGSDVFGPSDSACRFCPAAGDCWALMEKTTLQDFGSPPDTLSPDEIGDILSRIPGIRSWCDAVEKRALERAYSGEGVPGWKAVMSRGRRYITDHTAAVQALIDAGYPAETVARFQARPLGELERLVGKGELEKTLGGLIDRYEGKPSLVRDSDPRPAVESAAEAAKDFE